ESLGSWLPRPLHVTIEGDAFESYLPISMPSDCEPLLGVKAMDSKFAPSCNYGI
ncbi:Hypothetical protein FKW44_011395, partial [Caligus rogercresseyi]